MKELWQELHFIIKDYLDISMTLISPIIKAKYSSYIMEEYAKQFI